MSIWIPSSISGRTSDRSSRRLSNVLLTCGILAALSAMPVLAGANERDCPVTPELFERPVYHKGWNEPARFRHQLIKDWNSFRDSLQETGFALLEPRILLMGAQDELQWEKEHANDTPDVRERSMAIRASLEKTRRKAAIAQVKADRDAKFAEWDARFIRIHALELEKRKQDWKDFYARAWEDMRREFDSQREEQWKALGAAAKDAQNQLARVQAQVREASKQWETRKREIVQSGLDLAAKADPSASSMEAREWNHLVTVWKSRRASVDDALLEVFKAEAFARRFESALKWEQSHWALSAEDATREFREYVPRLAEAYAQYESEERLKVERMRDQAFVEWAMAEKAAWAEERAKAGARDWLKFGQRRVEMISNYLLALRDRTLEESKPKIEAAHARREAAIKEIEKVKQSRLAGRDSGPTPPQEPTPVNLRQGKSYDNYYKFKKYWPEDSRETEDLLPSLNRQDLAGQNLRDLVAHDWVRHLSMRTQMTTLLFGNPYREPDAEESSWIRSIVGTIVSLDGWVLYDADSAAAGLISLVAGDRGLGVTGTPQGLERSLKHVVLISNPYLRMKALSEPSVVAMTPDSVAGLGLAINQKVGYVFDPRGHWTSGLDEFEKVVNESGQSLGIKSLGSKIHRLPFPESAGRTLKADHHLYGEGIQSLDLDYEGHAKRMGLYLFRSAREKAQDLAKSFERIREIPGGAVVFGGARLEQEYAAVVYDSVARLASYGIPVATGGSGGFMELANTAAINAGADSIGIPILGGIKGERAVPSSTQTLTIHASGYESRIPLLLDRRQLILLAPGGSGTMKELGTAILHFATHSDTTQRIVFLGSSYYGKLVAWFKSGAFPQEFAQKVRLVGMSVEANELVQEQEQLLGSSAVGLLRTEQRPVPRPEPILFNPQPPAEPPAVIPPWPGTKIVDLKDKDADQADEQKDDKDKNRNPTPGIPKRKWWQFFTDEF